MSPCTVSFWLGAITGGVSVFIGALIGCKAAIRRAFDKAAKEKREC